MIEIPARKLLQEHEGQEGSEQSPKTHDSIHDAEHKGIRLLEFVDVPEGFDGQGIEIDDCIPKIKR